VRRYDETAARELLARGLNSLGMDLAAMKLLRPSDPRKQALAWLIRTKSIVAGSCITRELDMVIPATSVVPLTSYEPQINRSLRI
jgi:hypothetical protein